MGTSEERVMYDLSHKTFAYETGTGYLIRKVGIRSQAAGSIVGTLDREGYVSVGMDKRPYMAHRIIFLMHNGYWPDQIDHINGIRHDNRIRNLRDVNSIENSRNAALSKNNTSGVIGVSPDGDKWKAYISAESEVKYLGLFADKGDAIAARRAAERKYGYHENHGRRAL